MHLYTVISVCNGRTMIDGEWTDKTFVGTYGTFTSWKEADDKMGEEYESSINELLDYYGHDSETSNNIVRNSHREDGQAWVSRNGDDREVHYIVLSENDEQYLG